MEKIEVHDDKIVFRKWWTETMYFWDQILSAELQDYSMMMKGSLPLKRKAVCLKTKKKQYRICVSNKYSSEIKNPEGFIEELQKHLTLSRVSKPDHSKRKLLLWWVLSFFFLLLFQRFLKR